jgi:hypothetical protein
MLLKQPVMGFRLTLGMDRLLIPVVRWSVCSRRYVGYCYKYYDPFYRADVPDEA